MAFEFEVGPIWPHFGVLIGEAAQIPGSVVLAPPRYGHGRVDDGDAWWVYTGLANLHHILATQSGELSRDAVCGGGRLLLGCLAQDMTRMGLRTLILSIWAPWPQILPERASDLILSIWAARPQI